MLAVKDPRLEMIYQHFAAKEGNPNVFQGKRILDIGSHSGQMAL